MLIRQTRINSSRYFSSAKSNEPIYIKVDNVNRFLDKLNTFGFDTNAKDGDCILPCPFNINAKNNAEMYFTIDSSLPKEKYIQTLYWTRNEWAGRGETREVTEFVDIVRYCKHRNWHAPYSVKFTYVTADEPYIISDGIIYNPENIKKLINTVNMLLGLFGECTISYDSLPDKIKRKHLDWDIFPQGKYPWDKMKNSIEEITKNENKTQKAMMVRNCKCIVDMNPKFVAYGRSGFRGYIVFGFPQKNIYVLESMFPNNATYIFDSDWESLSKLTKAEILSGTLQKDRIIHSTNWERNFKKIMGE